MTRIAGTDDTPTTAETEGLPHWRRRLSTFATIPLLALLVSASAPAIIQIHRGDTLWEISQRYGVSVAALKRLNTLPSDTIYAGQQLRIPEASSGSTPRSHNTPTHAATTRQHYPAHVVASAERHRAELASRPGHSRKHVQSLIRKTAKDLGVDPALALAVAQQESGFQMNVVSEADAIGAMQVLPSTGKAMSRVVGRQLDLLDVDDNVLAGVALLDGLTHSAPLRDAIAGYYQGLASVRARGMLPSTVRYVDNVLALREQWR